MDIPLAMISRMQSLGLFGSGDTAVLDVGSSNHYQASRQNVIDFLCAFGIPLSERIQSFSERLEKYSAYDAITGGTNNAFVGELLEVVGMRYNSIDIADGYNSNSQ